jgi:hypothetical protein
MIIKKQDLIDASVAPDVIQLFEQFEPDGQLTVTVDSVTEYMQVGLNVFALAQRLLPAEAWSEYLRAEEALDKAHAAAIGDARNGAASAAIMARTAMLRFIPAIVTQAGSDLAALARPTLVAQWDERTTPERLRKPLQDALATLDAAMAEAQRTVEARYAALSAEAQAATAKLEADKIAALVAVIDALPEDVPAQ